MKAWEYTTALTKNAVPIVRTEEEQTWTAANESEKAIDNLTSLMWTSQVPGSAAPESVIIGAVQSLEQLGYDVSEAEKLLPSGLDALAKKDFCALNAITGELNKALYSSPKDETSDYWKYHVYESFEEYEKSVVFPPRLAIDFESEEFKNKTREGWYARLAGGALGTELEGYTTAQLIKKFGDIRYYIRKPNTYNDDITYELALLFTIEKLGRLPSSSELASSWLAYIPTGWSAEQVALDNLKRGIYPPESGSFRNAYQEWIGAQMRGAICGQVAPGNPYLAAKLAWADGEISHHGNGILGEVFNALLVSLAFAESDMKKVLLQAIHLMPADSQYRSILDFALKACEEEKEFFKAWSRCEKEYEKYNWIHSYPNAAAEVVSLYFGEGDFDETMHLIATCGQDVDCNAAQIAVALASLKGAKPIARKWYEAFEDEIVTYLRAHKSLNVETLVLKTIKACQAIN